jgi:hypothetical protein
MQCETRRLHCDGGGPVRFERIVRTGTQFAVDRLMSPIQRATGMKSVRILRYNDSFSPIRNTTACALA